MMPLRTLGRHLMIATVLVSTATGASYAKPNSYPGENSKFKSQDPAAIAQQKAEQQKRIDLRKQKRQQRKRERLEKRNNRSN